MSDVGSEEVVKSAVPIADLSVLDKALRGRGQGLEAALKQVRPADVGRDLSRRTRAQGRRLLEASDDRRGAAMLRAAHPAVAANLLARCDAARAARFLAFMPTEHRVAILDGVAAGPRAKIEEALDPEDRAEVVKRLASAASSVGRLLTSKVWRCPADATVGEAMKRLQDRETDIEVAQNCYFVDGERLVGVAALRELAVADPSAAARSVMKTDVIAVTAETERSDAAEIIRTHDFLSLPAIDGEGRLIGAVRVDDLLDSALSKAGTGLLNQGGVAGKLAGSLPYFQVPLTRVIRSRVTWLVLLFVAETATGTVLRYFEDELARVVALSFFIPLLIGTGGNAGSQTVSTIIRALALGEVRFADTLRVLGREVLTGLALGLLLGGIAFGRALMWGVGMDLALCVAITVLVVCTWANLVGSLIPLGAQKVGIDPTVISGPLITTLVDASGLFIYLSIAKLTIAALATP
ncbi:MAG: magnesium transporter [Kofleriaceae bacterium]|nr:magnesium transporter [Kofleriaceae bacterium]